MTLPSRTVPVAVIAVVSGLLAVAARAAPTGQGAIDALLVAIAVATATWLGARAAPGVILVTALVSAALSASIPLAALGAASAVVGREVARRSPTLERLANATVSAVALNIAIRSDLDVFFGAATIVGVAVAIVLAASGVYRSDPRTRRVAVWTLVGISVVALASTAVVAVSAFTAIDTLDRADHTAEFGLERLARGDIDEARVAFSEAADDFAEVHQRIDSPFGTLARFVPVVAQHRRAALDVSGSAADATADIVVELDEFDLGSLTATPGRIDIDALRSLEAPLLQIRSHVDDMTAAIDDARSAWLFPSLDRRLDGLTTDLSAEMTRADDALRVVRAAPDLLGASEPRTYFVAFTTPVEARGLGGFMGNWAQVDVDDGAIELTRFGRTEYLDKFAEPGERQLDGPEEWLRQYGRFGYTNGPNGTVESGAWGNLTMSPQASSIGQVAAQLYPQSGGTEIDGWFALDIEAVSALLEFTGPVDTDFGVTLDTDNAADFLMHGQYTEDDRAERQDMLSEVSSTVLDRLLSNPLPEPSVLFDVMGPMVEQGRIVGWAQRPDEQELLEWTGLAGGLPDPGTGDGVAVTFNNAIGNKIDYYLETRAHYSVEVDADDSTAHANLYVELHNGASVEGEPLYVVGNEFEMPLGTNRTLVSMYTRLPVDEVRLDGEPVLFDTGVEAGYVVTSIFVVLDSQQTRALSVDLSGSVDLTEGYRLSLHSPPTANPTVVSADVAVVDGTGAVIAENSFATDGGTTSSVVRVR